MAEQDMAMPQVAIGIMEYNGKEVMCLEIATASTRYQCAIATKENYRQVADKIKEGIMRAGAEMRTESGLIEVRGLPDGLRKKEGR